MVGQNHSATRHAWVEERLSEYLDNRLAAHERARLEQHLRECADCRASYEALRWTVALVKQAPTPVSARAFTLPVPAPRAARPSLALSWAQFGAALATLLLIAAIGVDVIMQWGGGMGAPMISTAKEMSAPTLEFAAAPTAAAPAQMDVFAPTVATELAAPTPPTVAAAPTKPPAPTTAPKPTLAPPAAAPMSARPTATPDAKSATADGEKARGETAVPRVGMAITMTMPAPTATLAPTLTATSVPPTPTATVRVAQARAEPTRVPPPQGSRAAPPSLITPLRVVEVGLLVLAVFCGALVVILWRRNR